MSSRDAGSHLRSKVERHAHRVLIITLTQLPAYIDKAAYEGKTEVKVEFFPETGIPGIFTGPIHSLIEIVPILREEEGKSKVSWVKEEYLATLTQQLEEWGYVVSSESLPSKYTITIKWTELDDTSLPAYNTYQFMRDADQKAVINLTSHILTELEHLADLGYRRAYIYHPSSTRKLLADEFKLVPSLCTHLFKTGSVVNWLKPELKLGFEEAVTSFGLECVTPSSRLDTICISWS